MNSRHRRLKRLYLSAVLVLCFALHGCQVSKETTREPVEHKRTYNTSFDKTWNVLVKVLSEASYPFKMMEKSSGVIQTDNTMIDAETAYSYSTTQKSAGINYVDGTMNLKFLLQSQDSLTTVQIKPYIQVTFSVYKVFESVRETHILESNGALEQSLFEKIEDELVR